MGIFRKASKAPEAVHPLDLQPGLAGTSFTYVETNDFMSDVADRNPGMIEEALDAIRAHPTALLNDRGSRLTPDEMKVYKHGVVDVQRGILLANVAHMPPAPTLYYQGPRLDASRRVSSLTLHGSLCGLDLHPASRQVLATEYQGGEHSSGGLVLVDLDTGRRKFLCSVGPISGREAPQISANGRWCLLNNYRGPVLVDLSTGEHASLPLKAQELDWWPARGPSSLFVLTQYEDGQEIGHLDLATSTYESEGRLQLPAAAEGLSYSRRSACIPRMSPSGREVLVGTAIGPSPEYQEQNGSRNRVALIDLETRRLEVLVAPFLDSRQLAQRQHSSWTWASRVVHASSHDFVLHESFAALMRPAGDDLAPLPTPDSDIDETLLLWH